MVFINNKRLFFRVLSLLFVILLYCLAVRVPMALSREEPDQIEILVIGTGRIIKDNIAGARKAAISEALIKGVEEYLTRYLGSQGMINNFPRLIHDVIPGSGEEIENFHILAEERHEHDYKVLVQIKVNEKLMEDKLKDTGIILMEGPPVKLLFLVSQKKVDDHETLYWWGDPDSEPALTSTELVLHRIFQERGFSPVSRLASVPEEKLTSEMRGLNLTEEDAAKWGDLFSADFVILGESEIVDDKRISLRLKVIDVADKSLLAQDSQTETVVEDTPETDRIMEALEKGVTNIADRLIALIMESRERSDEEVSTMEIELRGLKSLKQFMKFLSFLRDDIAGVNSVVQTRIKGDDMTLSVEFSGNREMFLQKVIKNEKFPLLADINRTDRGRVVIQFK